MRLISEENYTKELDCYLNKSDCDIESHSNIYMKV